MNINNSKKLSKIVKAIGLKVRTNVLDTPHPTLVTIGIGFAISVVITMVLSLVDGTGSSVFSIHEAAAVGGKSGAGGGPMT